MLQLVSIIGALGVLGAFAADQFGWVDPGRLSYALANFVGFVLLQGVWSVVSLWGAFVIVRARRDPRAGRR